MVLHVVECSMEYFMHKGFRSEFTCLYLQISLQSSEQIKLSIPNHPHALYELFGEVLGGAVIE